MYSISKVGSRVRLNEQWDRNSVLRLYHVPTMVGPASTNVPNRSTLARLMKPSSGSGERGIRTGAPWAREWRLTLCRAPTRGSASRVSEVALPWLDHLSTSFSPAPEGVLGEFAHEYTVVAGPTFLQEPLPGDPGSPFGCGSEPPSGPLLKIQTGIEWRAGWLRCTKCLASGSQLPMYIPLPMMAAPYESTAGASAAFQTSAEWP